VSHIAGDASEQAFVAYKKHNSHKSNLTHDAISDTNIEFVKKILIFFVLFCYRNFCLSVGLVWLQLS